MGSCQLYPHCVNQKGEVVESKLFRDLYNYTSDRQLANEFYGVGINQEFLDKVREEAEFDENGEITFNSLRKLAGLNVDKEKVLNKLNEEIKSGKYSYEDAITKLQEFNRNNQFKDEYLATIEQIGDNKYKLSVVEKNSKTEEALHKEISNRNLQDRIIYRLRQLGVDVSFLENSPFLGRYSTKNAKQTAEGLYQLITLSSNEYTDQTLAEEAGHFAIGALGKSPLVERLLKLLTPELQRQILGDEYDSKVLGPNPAREVAGVLVGRALNKEVDKNTPWQNLVSKIVNLAKRIFYTISRDTVSRDLVTAEAIAKNIAQGLMSPNFMGNVETALQHQEVLYDDTESVNVSTFKEAIRLLKQQVEQMKQINSKQAAKYQAILDHVENRRKLVGSAQSDSQAIEGITEALLLMVDQMVEEIPALLDSVKFEDRADFNTNMSRNAKNLRIVRTYVKTANDLINLVKLRTGKIEGNRRLTDIENVHIMDKYGGFDVVHLLDVVDRLEKSLTGREGIVPTLVDKERALYIKFLESAYGNTYIYRAARVIFKTEESLKNKKIWKGLRRIDTGEKKKVYTRFVNRQVAENIPLEKYVDHMQNDITYFEKWLASMSNSSDLVHQISDKVAKEANKRADDLTNQDWDHLRSIKARLSKLGIHNTEIFMERSAIDGTLTGNIITELNRGDWETAYAKFKEKAKEDFKKDYPNIDQQTELNKSIIWGSWYKNKVKREFHDIHSTWNDSLKMYEPNRDSDITSPEQVSYTNRTYIEKIQSNPAIEALLKEYIELKKDIDKRLPEGSSPWYRAPQFKGTFSNKVRNRKVTTNTGRAVLSTLRKTLRDIFCEDCDDTEFGSDQTYDTVQEDTFDNAFDVEMEKIHRVPLYGINKMRDMSQLSTDLFHSTLAYSGMANTHAALGAIVDVMEVGSEVLMNRKIGSTTEREKNKIGYVSKSYSRYQKFLDKQVYLIGQPKINITRKIVLNKIANFLNSISRAIFLGGNVAGGIVNTGTGSIEIFKEAATGQYFDLKDWVAANKLYFKSLPANIAAVGSNFKQDEVSLFMRHFNVLNNSRSKHRDFHTNDSWIVNALEDSLYLPYKTGDHYMQSISYLSLANHIKVYDSSGKEMTLFEAYSRKGLDDAKGSENKELGLTYGIKDITFKNKDDIDKYYMLKNIIEQVNEYNTNNANNPILGATINLSYEEEQLLESLGYGLQDVIENPKTVTDLQNILTSYTWNQTDESDFMNKAREINIRLHGIYNSYDGVAFQQSIYGQLLLSMRQYALGLLERRISASKFNTMLGEETEGTLTTLAKVALACNTDESIGTFSTIMAIMCPFRKKEKEALKNYGFSDTQIHNLKRNWFDGVFIMALWALSALTAAGDDDDEDDTIVGLAHYFFTRWAREQSAFNTPYGIREEGNSVANLTPSALSGLVYIYDTIDLSIGAFTHSRNSKDGKEYYYSQGKKGWYDKKDPKYQYKILSKVPYWRLTYLLNSPYEATKSYKYGQKVNN